MNIRILEDELLVAESLIKPVRQLEPEANIAGLYKVCVKPVCGWKCRRLTSSFQIYNWQIPATDRGVV